MRILKSLYSNFFLEVFRLYKIEAISAQAMIFKVCLPLDSRLRGNDLSSWV